MSMIEVKVKRLVADARLPEYKSEGAAGADLYACLTEPITVPAFATVLIPTGIAIELPPGYQGEIRSRSGLALKENVFVLNGCGTLDWDYRDELMVILSNFSSIETMIKPFDRIAQLVIMPVVKASFSHAELSETPRRGGFGSTGK